MAEGVVTGGVRQAGLLEIAECVTQSHQPMAQTAARRIADG